MTQNDLQRAALVLFAARQVGPRGCLEQMKAICYCMRNRVRAGWYDGNWMRAIEEAQEIEPHFVEPFKLDPNNRDLQRMTREIDEVFYGDNGYADGSSDSISLESSIGAQKYWMFLGRDVSSWFALHVIGDRQNHPSRTQMGTMIFFE